MKLFIDSANPEDIYQCVRTGLVDGVTTNPTLMKKSGLDTDTSYQQILDMGVKDLSMEVVGETNDMVKEATRLIDKFGIENCTIKVPLTPDGIDTCKLLSDEGVKVNVTLIFSAAQAILAAKAGAYYASVFVGRCDDNSVSGLEVVRSVAEVYGRHGVPTQVLSASIRDVYKVTRSFYNGASVVTMPPAIFHKMYNHVLTDAGMVIFNKDAGLLQSS